MHVAGERLLRRQRSLVRPQDLRSDRDRDLGGLLAADTGDTDRAHELLDRTLRQALLAETFLEAAALGQGADQSAVRSIAALQDAVADVEVQRVTV